MSSQAKQRSASAFLINLLLLATSTLFAFLSVEFALTLHESLKKQEKIRQRPDFDTRTRLEVIQDLINDGIDAFPPFQFHKLSSGFHFEADGRDILPIVGISDLVIVACNELGEYFIYRSDEYGFNNAKGSHRDRPPVAAIGDSFTNGSCVKTEDNAVSVIARTYPGALNLGRGGNGPLINLATFIEYAVPLQPRDVVWFHYEGNDMVDLNLEKRIPQLRRYLEADFSQGLRLLQPGIDAALREFILIKKAEAEVEESRGFLSKLVRFRHLRARIGRISRHTESSDYDLLREILVKARDSTASWGGNFYFVYLPAGERYKDDNRLGADREAVLGVVEELLIPYVDITEQFLANGDPTSFFPFNRPGGHYNEQGYQLVGESVVTLIAQKSNR